jgi:hypothetical protein
MMDTAIVLWMEGMNRIPMPALDQLSEGGQESSPRWKTGTTTPDKFQT